ncbi:MAG: LysM peptidoglycan-binding domain-containing protein [Clostridia bacterium]|nr:LysM peptidoglycan-binding domain-containing protein [Clostridia bacterium]
MTILACTAVMAASTFALFYSEVSTDHSTIASAYYSVTVDNAENGTYICPLVFEDKHTFVITANGTATTGYCKIQVGANTYYTEQIFKDQSLVLTVQAAKDTPIIFTPGWGTLSEETCGNEIKHSETPSTVYTVEPTARLSSIAAHYGVTEEDILIYNNLLAATVDEESSTPLLPVGMELKIPNPAENVEPYRVPYATYIVEPTATLDAISAYYGISVEDIIAFNDMTAYGVGMSLKIPNTDPYLPDYAVPYAIYVVEPTATIGAIAAYYGVSETDILSYNNISEIAVGMELKIPGATTETSYAVPYAVYIMQDGATLDNIAIHYDVSIDDIIYYNNYPNLTVGYELKIPGVAYDYPAYNYVAPIPEPPASTDENTSDNTQGENNNPPVVDDTVSSGDVGTGEQQTEQQPAQEPVSEELAVLYPNDNDYYLISESTITLKNADILIYKGHEYETVESYQKDLDRRITGIEAVADINNKTGEYFCELLTNAETLSLCLEITENIELGYLKIIIGESEYYTVQLKKDAYIRLDIVAPIGTEIRFEAYEGVPVADTFYGDDLKNDTDGNNPLLDHTWLVSQNVEPVDPVGESTDPITEDNTVSDDDTTPTEQPTVEIPTEDTTSTEETPTTEQPTEEPAPAGDEVPTDTGATE